MQVNASIDEADIGRIAPAQPVTFRVDAYPGETFTGTRLAGAARSRSSSRTSSAT